ncbi:MAG: glycosyltransferase family 4 protein [Xanthomonadaceae bacterium]|nr:glycosyltransferase family 4 protein [Xanthomonadaceae bacterium]
MKVLLTNFHEGDGGGHTTYLMALARGLGARHEIHVAAPPTSRLHREASSLDGVRALAQPFPNGVSKLVASLRARRQLRDYLRRHAFDIVHVNGSADHRLVLSAIRGLPRPPKIVFTKHNSKPATGFTHRLRAKRTDLAIAVSDATLRELQATPYAACAPRTIRNGVDIAHYAPWPATDALAERDRWCGRDALLLGSNAGTAAHKGWMDLVEAIATLPVERRARVHVLLCGKPPTAEQVARIEALGLSAQVHFAGLLSDVRPMIAAIDAGFVLSHAVETISFACREMMAMGKPVLVSDYAGLPENIEAGVDGWIVPVRDRAAIARAVEGLLDDRDHLPAMGVAARRKAEREFGLGGFVDATEAAYVALLPRAGAPQAEGHAGR